MQKVKEYIKEKGIFNNSTNVIIGLSGGADSVCLLYCLYNMKTEMNLNLHAVHVNHMIRETAKRDEDFVINLCEKLNIPLKIYQIDCIEVARKDGLSVEEAGRNERYRLFNEAGSEVFGKNYVIALAHHSDDVAETLLFNLARGTGINGLASIKPVSRNIVRPLLGITRKEIICYLENNGLSHVEDETNLCDDYSRNKIRHNIIPIMNDISKKASEHISQTASQLADIEDYLSIETEKAFREHTQTSDNSGLLIKASINECHPAIRTRIIHKALITVARRARDISSIQIDTVEDMFNLQVGRKRNLIYGIEAVREYDGVSLYGVDASEDTNMEDKLNKVTMELRDRDLSEIIPCEMYTKWLDYDKITCWPSIRFRQKDDYIIINDNNDKKLLSDYMKNEKIPAKNRDRIPVVADGNHVLWVIGYRISAAAKVSDKTTKLLVLEYKDKEKENGNY